jgi:hypothetical protein
MRFHKINTIEKLDKNDQLKQQQVGSLVQSIGVATRLFKSARAD